MSTSPSIKEIWRAMDILVYMFREVGRSVMGVEYFIRTTGKLKLVSNLY